MLKFYTIIGGANGVGKSSLSVVLLNQRNDMGIIIDTDKITSENGVDKLHSEKIAIRRIDSCLEKGVNFTQETTLSGIRTIKTIKKAIEKDYCIRLYYVGISGSEESLTRIANRVRKGGHDIPHDNVVRRYETRFDDLIKVLDFCNEAVFFDNENGFVEVGEYKNGRLIINENIAPRWIKELEKDLSYK